MSALSLLFFFQLIPFSFAMPSWVDLANQWRMNLVNDAEVDRRMRASLTFALATGPARDFFDLPLFQTYVTLPGFHRCFDMFYSEYLRFSSFRSLSNLGPWSGIQTRMRSWFVSSPRLSTS